MELWQPYIIAIVTGLLVGIERERSRPGEKTLGVRTFLLISILGALAGDLENILVVAALTAFTLGLILISYYNQTRPSLQDADRGLTTEFAAGITFVLGYITHQLPEVAALLGTLLAFILFSKKPLHQFTQTLKPAELKAALLIILAGVIVINFVPDHAVDPWGIFVPKKLGILILLLAILEFAGYVATKVLGEKKGSIVLGFFGGIVSSTAVLLSSARQARQTPERWKPLVVSAIAAKLAAFAELLLIVGMLSPKLFFRVLAPIALSSLIGISTLWILTRKPEEYKSSLVLQTPLNWSGVLRWALTLAGVLAVISLAEIKFGNEMTFALTFLTGLFELHATSLATTTMYSTGQLSLEAAAKAIFIAAIASLLAKTMLSWIIARGAFARNITLFFLPMEICFALSLWFAALLTS